MKWYHLIFILPILISAETKKCRNCGLVIDTAKTLDMKTFFSDTFHSIDGEVKTINNLIAELEVSLSIVFIMRIGDRPAWVNSAVEVVKEIIAENYNVPIVFIFLDTDSALAIQTKSMLEYMIKSEDFKLLYTTSYTLGENVSQIDRWNLQTTPAILVCHKTDNSDKVELKPLYVPVFSTEQLLLRIKSMLQ